VSKIRGHISYANVMATIAVFVALGGTSIAAVSLSKNSVGAKQIKRNAVRAPEVNRNAVGASELRANAVAGGDVADGSLGTLDLADSSINAGKLADNAVIASKLADNAVGPLEIATSGVGTSEVADGSLGEADLQAGLLDVNLSVTVQRTDLALADNTTQAVEASCLPGSTAVAGGSSVDQTGSDDITQLVSRPGNGGFIPADGQSFNDWRAVYRNPAGGTGAAEIRAFIVCVEIP
jgi:hypothetical protein